MTKIINTKNADNGSSTKLSKILKSKYITNFGKVFLLIYPAQRLST